MELLNKARNWGATLTKFNGKVVKAKPGSGDDAVRKKVVQCEFEVTITKAIKELLGPRIAALVKMDGANGAECEIEVNSIDCARQPVTCVLAIYSKANYSDKSEPEVTRGGAGDDNHASVTLTKLANREDKSVMVMHVDTYWDEAFWMWGGKALGEGEVVLSLKPLQPELPLEAEKAKGAKDEAKTPE